MGVVADTAAPAAPGSLTAVAGAAGQINLGWTAATDNAAVSGYRVERCLGAGCSNFAEVATPVTTSFADSGLASSTSYSVPGARRRCSGNLGGYSNVTTAVTAARPRQLEPAVDGRGVSGPYGEYFQGLIDEIREPGVDCRATIPSCRSNNTRTTPPSRPSPA